MIRKLLVANRGEIALRVFRAARELGIGTVAVVAPDDKGSLHARSADETMEIASYLFSEEHIRAAKQSGADAIHPGYGFLAENPDFAEAVNAAELTWVGPPPEALRAGGDKLEAKRIASEAGVPVVPTGEPEEIGFPLVVKAAAGGGGRGMRVVREPSELEEALAASQREAKAAFGDERVFCERYVERPRHVEVQLLADAHGSVLGLGERECSIQRRHQKVLEESPSSAIDETLRTAMSDAAVAFARAIGYESAGTAEFMVDDRDYWFLELNGRIQVEHPVTELVTGVDLVQLQLHVAAGDALDLRPDARGHAVEVRLYAEDPRTFFPQTGRIERLRLPEGIRVDAGVAEGDEIGIAYDPLIAKLIAHGSTRDEAFDRLRDALKESRRHDNGIPHGAPAAVSPAGTCGGRLVADTLSVEPRVTGIGASAGPRSKRGRPSRNGGRAEPRHRADAGNRDSAARRCRRLRAGQAAARRPGGDEDGDAADVTVRRRGARSACLRRRPGRRRHRPRRAGGVAIPAPEPEPEPAVLRARRRRAPRRCRATSQRGCPRTSPFGRRA